LQLNDKIESYLDLINKTETLESSDKLKKKFLEILNKSKEKSEHDILPDMLTYSIFPD
jgi:hypothetical protein